nr:MULTISPECIES: ABC transporter ATP-binding protein [unclassified Corynebacterium]
MVQDRFRQCVAGLGEAAMIEVENLHYRYSRSRPVLNGVSFSHKEGLVSLLGENGAGKSTLMRILATEVTSGYDGTVVVAGEDLDGGSVRRIRSSVGWVPQDFPFDSSQKVQSIMRDVAWLRGVKRADREEAIARSLRQVGLEDRGGDKAGNLSGGLRRRLVIAAGLVHDPSLLLLDEPTAGLDPKNRRSIMSILQKRAAAGTAIVMSTHVAEDVMQTDRVAFLAHGRIVASGKADSFMREYGDMESAFEMLTEG